MTHSKKPIRLLIFGDVVGRLGRRVLAEKLFSLRETYSPDAVIANVENLAHGKGITDKTIAELSAFDISVFTSGDHIWDKQDPALVAGLEAGKIALPANDPRTPAPFRSALVTVGQSEIHVVNLLGQVFMPGERENPFKTFDSVYAALGNPRFLVVDCHMEVTSEKVAMGWYTDGRASLVYGTHTHVPTADDRILPNGTGYLSDIGMTGLRDGVLGVDRNVIIKRFLDGEQAVFQYPEEGPAWFNALLCDLDPETGRCVQLKRLQESFIIN